MWRALLTTDNPSGDDMLRTSIDNKTQSTLGRSLTISALSSPQPLVVVDTVPMDTSPILVDPEM